MALADLVVEPVTNVLGAMVWGVDLWKPLNEPTVRALTDAWVEHKVLFFRDQPLNREQHKAFARSFGEIYHHPYLKSVGRDPDFVRLYSGGDTGSRFVAENWHTDVTFTPQPPMGSILRALEVPPYGGDTMWLDLEAAYASLSPPMQGFAWTLTGIHSAPRASFVPGDTSGEVITSRHPVVRTHPVTGRRSLFVNPVFTRSIEGLTMHESEALLAFFHTCCQRPEHQVRIRWEPDTIAMWDNRCTQHKVVADNLDATRKMERITLQGETPT